MMDRCCFLTGREQRQARTFCAFIESQRQQSTFANARTEERTQIIKYILIVEPVLTVTNF
jgi:hypothetical protein